MTFMQMEIRESISFEFGKEIEKHLFFVLSHARDKTKKTSFPISSPRLKFTISLNSIYKHYAADIVDPSSMWDACHMNFVIDLAHRGVSVAQW